MTTPASSPQALFDAGVAAHRAGRLTDACAAYQAVLARIPDHFDALHMLGLAWVQAGDAGRGLGLIQQAIAIRPTVAAAHANLAMALGRLGRHAAALASAERALALDPLSPEGETNRGNALMALGRPAEALVPYESALAANSADPQSHFNLANAFRDLGRFAESLARYDAAVALQPDYVEANANRAALLARMGRLDEALAGFDAAIAARPSAQLRLNRGAVLARLHRLPEALAAYDAVGAGEPASAEVQSRRSAVLNDLGRVAEALDAADRAIALDPGHAEAHNNRGIALYDLRRLDEARASYDRALALRPDFAEAHNNSALLRLLAGDLAGGFAEYRWRWRVGEAANVAARVAGPRWEGESLRGRRLLIWSEQGFGDSLQFVRYVPLAAALGARVTLLTEPALVRLFRASLPGVEVVDRLPEGAKLDVHLPMLCLPGVFATTLATIPAATPYLTADASAVAGWRRRLSALPGRKVGLVWAGASRSHDPKLVTIDSRRSLSLASLAPLAAARDVQFVSLQIGGPSAEARRSPPGLKLVDWTAEIADFADTAALVAALDLVITVDTSVAHLAGGLDRPVWILSRFDGCWRWLTDRDDSPWYPTAHLFRQPAPGDWGDVIAAVAARLARL